MRVFYQFIRPSALDNEKNGNYIIPSVQELSAAGRVLHFMLLALVYRAVSLDDSAIKKAISRFSYRSEERRVGKEC